MKISSRKTNFGVIDDTTKSSAIDDSQIISFAKNSGIGDSSESDSDYLDYVRNNCADIIRYAQQLKAQHENDSTQYTDNFYLEYAKRAIGIRTVQICNAHYQVMKQMSGEITDPQWSGYSYEEILQMANNGYNIPKDVLTWAQSQQELDLTDYVVISNNEDNSAQENSQLDSDINKLNNDTRKNIIKANKTNDELSKKFSKVNELSQKILTIKNEQNIQNNLNDIERNNTEIESFLSSIEDINLDIDKAVSEVKELNNTAEEFSKYEQKIPNDKKNYDLNKIPKSVGILDSITGISNENLADIAIETGRALEANINFIQTNLKSDESTELSEFAKNYSKQAKELTDQQKKQEEAPQENNVEKNTNATQTITNSQSEGEQEINNDKTSADYKDNNKYGVLPVLPGANGINVVAGIVATEISMKETNDKREIVKNTENILNSLSQKSELEAKKLKFKTNKIESEITKYKIEQVKQSKTLESLERKTEAYNASLEIKKGDPVGMKSKEQKDPYIGEKQAIYDKFKKGSDKENKLIKKLQPSLKSTNASINTSKKSDTEFNQQIKQLGEKSHNNHLVSRNTRTAGIVSISCGVLMVAAALASWPFVNVPLLIQGGIAIALGTTGSIIGNKGVHTSDETNGENDEHSQNEKDSLKDIKEQELLYKKLNKKYGIKEDKKSENQTTQNNNSENNQQIQQPQSLNNQPEETLIQEDNSKNSTTEAKSEENNNEIPKETETNNKTEENLISASASSNANTVENTQTSEKADKKLTRFNNDSIIESKKKSKKVQAISASTNGNVNK